MNAVFLKSRIASELNDEPAACDNDMQNKVIVEKSA